MSTQLQDRAKRFIHQAVPSDIDYVLGSIAERMITTYAADGALQRDGETREMLELILMETDAMVSKESGAGQAYFRESAEILRAILGEMA